MANTAKLIEALNHPETEAIFAKLYGKGNVVPQQIRYRQLLLKFEAAFPGREEVELFSAPGRIEVGGNHTDHNAGRVLAATVDLDALAAVSRNGNGLIRVHSEGYPPLIVRTTELEPVEGEKHTSTALVRGVCARLARLGYSVGGFEACITSNVLKGSGLSSSAAFEILITTIFNHLYNRGEIDPILLAQVGQFAENQYFGKPCGLMDQTTSVVGGFVTIDFQDFTRPRVKKVEFDFASSGFALVIVDTGGSHADLTDDYAALPAEMKQVAGFFGGKVLREISRERIIEALPQLRGKVSDRAILRALHFFADDQRVVDQVEALEQNDFPRFLRLVVESGHSSSMLAQNSYTTRRVDQQGVSLALAVSELILKGRGAWRVHGGGFAGTIQAFVPHEILTAYVSRMRAIFGEKSCYVLMIRPLGAGRVDIK